MTIDDLKFKWEDFVDMHSGKYPGAMDIKGVVADIANRILREKLEREPKHWATDSQGRDWGAVAIFVEKVQG